MLPPLFTLGHQYLCEVASASCDTLHLFVVSEDASLFPFSVRKRLVQEGTAHLPNVVLHDSGSYIISSATFPSYFLKDEASVIRSHARLDITLFEKISQALGIQERFIGEEPRSQVTSLYNEVMAEELPKAGIACTIIPRKEEDGAPISASTVRTLLKEGNLSALKGLVPPSTYAYLDSPKAQPIIDKIRRARDVVHY